MRQGEAADDCELVAAAAAFECAVAFRSDGLGLDALAQPTLLLELVRSFLLAVGDEGAKVVPPMAKVPRRSMATTPRGAIVALRAALARIDRTLAEERVQRKKAEALLAHLAAIPVAVLVADSRARYVDVNEGALLLTGYTRRELLDMSVWDLTVDAKAAVGKAMWQTFLEAGELAGGYDVRRKDGRIVHTTFFAVAHVLPGLHVSALASRGLLRQLRGPRRVG
jgi:PAS domain S-box-containing protein